MLHSCAQPMETGEEDDDRERGPRKPEPHGTVQIVITLPRKNLQLITLAAPSPSGMSTLEK